MEQAPNKRTDSFASLPDDLVLKILRRLPGPSLFRCKLVCHDWECLIKKSDIHDKLGRQTVTGFFFDRGHGKRHFTSFTGVLPCFNFLPFYMDEVAVSDCCNGLVLCWCSAYGCYVVCNPMTRNYKVLPASPHDHGLYTGFAPLAGEAQLCFDPTVSSHFHVIDFVEVEDRFCARVQIYSFETNTWIVKECEWGEGIDLEREVVSRGVFLNSFLHNMGRNEPKDKSVIIAVDMEGNTWREIPMPPSLSADTLHQAHGHLCVCLVDSPYNFNYSMWILEDYGTNNWTLKHRFNLREMLGSINIIANLLHRVITVHPEWNLVFLAGHGRKTIIAYDMDHRKAHVMPTRLFRYSTRQIKEYFDHKEYYLPYVPLFSDSLEEEFVPLPLYPRVWRWNRRDDGDSDEGYLTDDCSSSESDSEEGGETDDGGGNGIDW